jgi:hypothetical protein
MYLSNSGIKIKKNETVWYLLIVVVVISDVMLVLFYVIIDEIH